MNNVDVIPINLVYKDDLSKAVLKRMLQETKRPYNIGYEHNSRGFGWIKNKINELNNAAKGMAWFVMTDLDQEECAPLLLRSWLRDARHPNLLLRIAVREVEAWLLGSRTTFAEFAGIKVNRIQASVEQIDKPKEYLINLVRRSKKRDLLEDIVPRTPMAKTGPDYNGRLTQYVQKYWDPVEAQENSPSLRKTIRALEEFQPVYEDQ